MEKTKSKHGTTSLESPPTAYFTPENISVWVMNEVLRNVTELKIRGQHLILGNPLEDEKFSWFSHRVISDVFSEPNYFKSIHSSTALPNVNLRFTCTFRELINNINDHRSKANPNYLGALKTHLLYEGNNFSVLPKMKLCADVPGL